MIALPGQLRRALPGKFPIASQPWFGHPSVKDDLVFFEIGQTALKSDGVWLCGRGVGFGGKMIQQKSVHLDSAQAQETGTGGLDGTFVELQLAIGFPEIKRTGRLETADIGISGELHVVIPAKNENRSHHGDDGDQRFSHPAGNSHGGGFFALAPESAAGAGLGVLAGASDLVSPPVAFVSVAAGLDAAASFLAAVL